MKPTGFVVALVVCALVASEAAAQYPSKPVRLIVPFPAGGAADISARSVALPLSQALGQPVVVDNKPGADGQIAALEVKRSAPDGTMIFWGSASSLSAVPALRKAPPYDPVADFTPISSLGYATFFLFTHASVPVATVKELIDYVRANPGKLNYGSANTTSIVAMAQLLASTNADMVHVPYKGEAQAIPDFIAGRVQAMFATPGPTLPQAREGRLRALAVLMPERSPMAPEVPTIVEAGYPLVSIAPWVGLFAPPNLPRALTQRLSREINAVLLRPDVREQHEKVGVAVRGSTPEALAQFVREQLETWGRTIREAKIPQE